MATTRFLHRSLAYQQFDPTMVRRFEVGLEETDVRGDRIVEALRSHGGMGAVDAWLDGRPGVPAEIAELLEPIAEVPDWVNWDRIERGAIAYWRGGKWSQLTLTCASLAAGYVSGAGVKPLIFTGQLVNRSYRRLQETARWMLATTSPGALRRNGTGFRETVRVRVMHSAVRTRLLTSGVWGDQERITWGAPINLSDTAWGIAGEFSTVPVAAMRDVGVRFSQSERDDIQHLWRYVGYLLGVPDDMLAANAAIAEQMVALKHLVDTPADDDSRALLKALIELGVPPKQVLPKFLVDLPLGRAAVPAVLYAFTRRWAGKSVADDLALPDTPLKYLGDAARPMVAISEAARVIGLRGSDERLAAKARASVLAGLDAGNAPAGVAADEVVSAVAG